MNSRASALWVAAVALSALTSASVLAADGKSSARIQALDAIEKLPDWSGVWVLEFEGGAGEAGQDAAGTDNGRVPLTAEAAQMRAEARSEHAQNNMSTCLPAGVPGVMQHGLLTEYLYAPGRVLMLFEDGEVRRIYTDGRAHQSLDDLHRSFEGDSIGHWEGDTLVVDTIGFPYGTLFQNYGLRATLKSHLVERVHKIDKDHLEFDSALTDPTIFTRPYTYKRIYKHSTLPLNEPMCAQNNRDTGTSIDLTPPPEDE